MNLVIVESPAKAKTIEGFLGKDFVVKSSYGHVRDLAKKGLSVDVENAFAPNYEVLSDKKKLISELKKLAKKSEMVWLATDEDREGEAISWHLYNVLGLKPENTKRIVFNEITKPAITKAIENPRNINDNLVNAQQARRVLDRLVGFELSPVLWKKVQPKLSAGRVQSVTVRLIVEREREIEKFTPQNSFKVSAYFDVDGTTLKAELNKKFKTVAEAKTFLNDCSDSNFSIYKLEKKPGKRTPAAPFTTSTLQQEASRKLGFSVAQTMSVAQRLYESGKITYMRTDSTNLSDTAIKQSKAVISDKFGSDYHKSRNYATKSKGAQEAHEAIRPTNLGVNEAGDDSAQERLYDLIWKRTIATQMADAKLERTTVTIPVQNRDEVFTAKGEVVKFDGFLKVYVESTDDEHEEDKKNTQGLLPPLKEGQNLDLQKIDAIERFTHHPPRYTEASLVKKLEELGIGRPSTYAPTISTIQKRGYVVKEDRDGYERKYKHLTLKESEVKEEEKKENTGAERKKLFPTDIGVVVNDFLIDNFNKILDYNFTAEVEKEFDDIAQGQLKWNKMIDNFYGPFHSNVENTLEHSERAKGERHLGDDPKTGKPVYAKIGRYGPMVQLGETESEEKPKFASLRKNQSIQQISLDEALELFKLPRELGEFEGEKVSANVGRYGPYVRHKSLFVSLKEDDPMEVNLDRAIELIKEKREQAEKNKIKTFESEPDLQVLKGRYGPYIKYKKKNFRIPKDVEPEELTLEDCMGIIEKGGKSGKGKKKPAKSTKSKAKKSTKAKKK
ncbi:MAG: type I DNA topoisomerase [Salibacter sp.]|uniref:type I DNA topoisomerase n=1 Tax=Salibacter sp. TaxID=2010995 RepID=UPI002870AB14|nr:type I DNA topoisomerase [Salibacter sp.]MDR9399352.1 type I DNA topoisomerase [Salibacter sp.]